MICIPTKISLREMATLVLASVLCFATTLPAKGQAETNSTPSVSQQLEKLAATLRTTQQQVEQSQKQIQQMQTEIDRLRALLAAKDAPFQANTVCAVAGTATLAGCSSYTNTTTPPGTSAITITATSGVTSHASTVNLTVQ